MSKSTLTSIVDNITTPADRALLNELEKPLAITMKGSSMFHTPGVIRAMANDFNCGEPHRQRAIKTVSDGWNLPVFRVEQLLGGECETEESGNDLKVLFPNNISHG